MINTIPVVAKAPILVLLLGNGMEPKIAIAAIICFFPTLVNMTRGLRDVRSEQLELMRILSATSGEIFFKIRVPNALPYLFSALKIAASTAVIGAIVGEWIGSTKGIGALIIQATYNFDSPCSTPRSSSARPSRRCSSARSRWPSAGRCAGTSRTRTDGYLPSLSSATRASRTSPERSKKSSSVFSSSRL